MVSLLARLRRTGVTAALLSLLVLVAGCAPAGAPTATGSQPAPTAPQRALTVSIVREPAFIAAFAPLPSQQASDFWQRMFNAFLDFYDDQAHPMPYLAEALPTLNTDSWVILPDGKMETRYHLKPNLIWHDGAPLIADDFVFSFEVSAPSNGFRTSVVPYTMIEKVSAPDDRTVLIRWKSIYADAGVLLGDARFGLVPLPRRLLEESYKQGVDAFQSSQYWTHEFVGAGPYKLDRWEIGSFIDAVAFDQHVFGRPKIDRIHLLFIMDPNTAIANLWSGNTDVALDSIRFAQVLQLKQEWAATGRGTAGVTTPSSTTVMFQHRPDYMSPRAIQDVRVHRAFAFGIDKQTFAETVFGGELAILDSIYLPSADYYPAIDEAITKYRYDPRASEQLMSEAGYTKAPDGLFASPTEGKLGFTFWAGQNRQELTVLPANWRQVGFEVQERALNPTESVDPELRSTFPAMYMTSFSAFENQQMALYRSTDITSAANRWRGENYTGWRSDEFDRLVSTFYVTLDQNERVQQRAQMAKLISDELPSIMLAANPNAHAFLNTVKNVLPTTPLHTTGRITWNIERWELNS